MTASGNGNRKQKVLNTWVKK